MQSRHYSLPKRLLNRLRLIWNVSLKLGGDRGSKLKLLFGGVWLFVNDDRKTALGFAATVRVYGRTASFYLADFSDYFTLSEILLQDEYGIELPCEPEVILDLGSNVGITLLYYRLRYPKARLYGFEPDPNNFKRLERVAQTLDNVEVYEVAVSSSDGWIEFYVNPHRGQSSSSLRRHSKQPSVEVRSVSLDTLLGELGIDEVDLLKFDVEGAELEVLSAFKRKRAVKTYVGEVHPDLMGGKVSDLLALLDDYAVELKDLGAHRYQVVAHRRV